MFCNPNAATAGGTPGILIGNSLACGVYMMVRNRCEALRQAVWESLPSYIRFSPLDEGRRRC